MWDRPTIGKMPHIHLETTSDLEENAHVPDILEALTLCLAEQETIPSKSIKAYHSLRSVWHMGEGAPAGFAHCEVALLNNRPLELRQKIAKEMMAVMRDQFASSMVQELVSITLEIREMDKDTYMK